MTTDPQKPNTSNNIITGFAIGLAIGIGDAIYEALVQQPWLIRMLVTCVSAGLVAGGVTFIGIKISGRCRCRKESADSKETGNE
jgi:hypothetical protein